MLNIINSRHGAAKRQDAAAALGESVLRGALKDGVLVQLWRGVIVDSRRLLEPETRAAAALFAAGRGAVLSHRTAAFLHGCTAADSVDVHVTVPYDNWVRSRPGLVIHHDRFDPADTVSRNGLPMCPLDETIAELLCTDIRWKALACLDQALAGLTKPEIGAFLANTADCISRRDDRRGTRRGESLLALAASDVESPQESRLRLVVIDAGFPVPVTQHPILTLAGELLYRLDLAWPELRIAVEYDGFEAHEGREENDLERDERLSARGWRVIRVRKEDMADSGRFLGDLRQAFTQRKCPVGA
ncbi:DUF559 domain-containing protein [Amycolatopsis acidicola]|uniref:DUF559 domain-containing protein n=1 Tax=Amycolatopsis acidicola TaxID=2596893 RepID=A0A5N0UMH7_9PSEU|nr:DUF559 domain-containing protein [Amycolatopsis acidicola]KAA9150095.1 DUF559 domain-containing protein [Amycolatopsis acidicola]